MILVSTTAMAAALAVQPPEATPPAPPPPPPPAAIMPFDRFEPSAPPPLPDPSPAARRLAMTILERVPVFEREARRGVMNALRGPIGGDRCDEDNPECRGAAEEIAAREAKVMVEEMHQQASRLLGAHFDKTLTAAQIAETTRFFGSDAGAALFASLFAMNAQTFMGLEPGFRPTRQRRAALEAEFARRTRHLPRSVRPVPPAPPPPPVPAPSPPRY